MFLFQFQNQAAVPSEVFTVNQNTFVRTDFQCHKRLSRLICKSSDKIEKIYLVHYSYSEYSKEYIEDKRIIIDKEDYI